MRQSSYDNEGSQNGAQRWKVVKEISVTDLVTIATCAASVFYAWSTVTARQAILEDRLATLITQQATLITQQANIDRRQDDDALRVQARLEGGLKDVNAKLDRLLERGGK